MRRTCERSLIECKKRGWRRQSVEFFNPHTNQRQDFLGIIDILALDGQPGLLGIQACSMSDRKEHMRNYLQDGEKLEALLDWLGHKNRFELWAWRKVKARKKDGSYGKQMRWAVDVTPILLEDLQAVL